MRNRETTDGMPWLEMMEMAYGVLGYGPHDFWEMTPPEWMAALAGWEKKHGIYDTGTVSVITQRELEKLMACFPDVIASGSCPRGS